MSKRSVTVKGFNIEIYRKDKDDYISLTSIAKYKNPNFPKDVIKNWLRNKNTIEFLGLWERINNPNFKGVEFDPFWQNAGSNSFVLSPKKWIESVNASGLVSKPGRYGGTYAQKDIAFEFASWISSEFKLYLIKEFQRLKEKEVKNQSTEWSLTRLLTKINYKIHTDSIKENLIPQKITKKDSRTIYAEEADLLNVALFNMTAKKWRKTNPKKKGNIRDYADIRQLICLSNLESINAELIRNNVNQKERLVKLNRIAIKQMKSLTNYNSKLLK